MKVDNVEEQSFRLDHLVIDDRLLSVSTTSLK